MNELGIAVLRFSDEQILNDMEKCDPANIFIWEAKTHPPPESKKHVLFLLNLIFRF
jgi:hypothetical protein